jgi:hypothetical protein
MQKILISRGVGAGWSTWNPEYPESLTSPEIIALVEADADPDVIFQKAKEMWKNGTWYAADDLVVSYVYDNDPFIIFDIQGAEYIRYKSDMKFITL